MASHLSVGRLNLNILRESLRRDLIDCLDKCQGSKALVWDDALTGPVGLVAEYTLLKEHDVDKMFPLRSGRLPVSSVQNIVFIVRPKLSLMELIAQNVLKEEEGSGQFHKDYHIIFVPRKSILCESKLKELGVHGTFTNFDEFCMELIPFDCDLLSMEMELSFRQCYLEKDRTSLFYVARALMTLQAIYGVIPSISGKGDCAADVVDMIMRMRRETAGSEPQIVPQIDNLLIIDRTVDPLTPLLTQLTYEGLIDEIFGISNTTVKLPPEKFAASSSGTAGSPSSAPSSVADMPSEPKKVILNSSEELCAELRDKNFHAVGPALSKKAKLISAEFDERHAAKTVGDIKQFVSKLPHMQAAKSSLATHTAIAELIKEVTDSDEFMGTLTAEQEFINGLETDKAHPFIEDCIAKQESLVKVLRLICIQCYCNSGFKPKLLEYYKREIIQTYGFQHLVTIHNLETVGLLKVQGATKHYPTVRKTLKLIVEEVNEQNPNDISYVFSGYAPLGVRLAHILHRPGWRSITEVLNILPGRTIDEVKQNPPSWMRKRHGSGSSTHSSNADQQKTTLIFFLGGVTYAEVSALRFLSQLEDGPADYIIASTKLINGSSWIQSLMNTYTPKPTNPF